MAGKESAFIRKETERPSSELSTYFEIGVRRDVTAEDMSHGLEVAATSLDYPSLKGILVERINTHALRSGGANALALAIYLDTQIQKMGRWRRATFKEYIREDLASYSADMSTSMKQKFNFVNVAA